jgi:murein hydrolase activator
MLKKLNMLKVFLLIGCLTALVCQTAVAQETTADLERQKALNKKEIATLKKELDKASGDKKRSLGQLLQIQNKLRLREQQIAIVNKQMGFIETNINQSWKEVANLKKEVDTLKLQYEKSVVYAYKNRSNYDFLNFVFSAATFNDAVRRLAYLKSYRAYREEQANNISRTQTLLQEKITSLKENQNKKSLVLKDENQEKKELESEKKEKDAIVSDLKAREGELLKEMANKKKNDMALSKAIKAVTEKARREAIAEARKKAEARAKEEAAKKTIEVTPKATTPSETVISPVKKPKPTGKPISEMDADPEIRELSDNFEKNKGSLPWPAAGTLSMHFGRQKYEGLDKIMIDNPGITLETKIGESVKAVFDGVVVTVTNIGPAQAVIMRHGKYFTTYSNLEGVSVSKGQQVKRGQALGKVTEGADGKGSLEFILSNDANVNLDPEKWLR